MTKDCMIRHIAKNAEITNAKAKIALETILDGITEALVKKEKVAFTGFGTFSAVFKEKRIGKNPRTLEKIEIPAKYAPVFKAGKTLKDSLK
jgi:DNA-binding protein HU-beta